MYRSTLETRCPHGRQPLGCPDCTDEMWREKEAVELAARDPETVDQWRRDFESWCESPDALRVEYGDRVPTVCPEQVP